MAKRKDTRIQHAEIVQRFAQRLRELRRTRGMTQKDLGERAGLTETYLSRLESAGAAPGIDLVAQLADALGTTIHDLLPVAESPDTRDVLRHQAERLIAAITEAADEESLSLLNQILAMLAEKTAKR
jgi:transcriptional regulator with XRE-family HTH domain